MLGPMRVAVRGLVVVTVGAALTAAYLFFVVPRLLDPDNMAAPLLFVGLPLFFIHALLLATLGGSLAYASRALCTERDSRTPLGFRCFRCEFGRHRRTRLPLGLPPCHGTIEIVTQLI
jgi:hypothetical protein